MKRTEYYDDIHNACIEAKSLIEDNGKTLIEWDKALDKVDALLNKIENHAVDLTDGKEDEDGQIVLSRK